MQAQRAPWVAADQGELLEGATSRVPFSAADGKSGSRLERVEIRGEQFFLKSLTYSDDWISRTIGDREFWPFKVWRAGVMDAAPDCIDHATLGMALEGEGDSARLSILMRDVSPWLVPEGDDVVPAEVHVGFLEHMAALHACFWGWQDEVGLTPMPNRLLWFAPQNIVGELAGPEVPGPIQAAERGWRVLAERAPRLHGLAAAIHADPGPLVVALATTPRTFLHGDWKMGNLGWDPQRRRTVLLDWAYPGEGPAAFDLAWYLALNRSRLPTTKEVAIECYRTALEGHGIDTEGWWERQLGLSLLAMTATIAWDKATGDSAELEWWEARAVEGASLLP